MTGTEFFNALAAQIAWHYGKSEGVNGAVACLFCIKNRSEGGWLRETLMDLYWGFLHESDSVPDPRDPQVQTFLVLVDDIMAGNIPDRLTAGAFFWEQHQGTTKVAQVGQLSLWR